MKTTAYWLTLAALLVAIAVLGVLKNAHADALSYTTAREGTDTEVETTILDNSKYPLILAQLECSGSDVNAMIEACGVELRKLCPDGGKIKGSGETAPGVLPARLMILIECEHEPPSA